MAPMIKCWLIRQRRSAESSVPIRIPVTLLALVPAYITMALPYSPSVDDARHSVSQPRVAVTSSRGERN